jgi:hypothetical protein
MKEPEVTIDGNTVGEFLEEFSNLGFVEFRKLARYGRRALVDGLAKTHKPGRQRPNCQHKNMPDSNFYVWPKTGAVFCRACNNDQRREKRR